MSLGLRAMPESEREQREAEIAGKRADASPHLGERARRIWLGAEARQLGHGGIKFVAQAAGAAIETVRSGIADLGKDPKGLEEGRSGGLAAAGRRPRTRTRGCPPPWTPCPATTARPATR